MKAALFQQPFRQPMSFQAFSACRHTSFLLCVVFFLALPCPSWLKTVYQRATFALHASFFWHFTLNPFKSGNFHNNARKKKRKNHRLIPYQALYVWLSDPPSSSMSHEALQRIPIITKSSDLNLILHLLGGFMMFCCAFISFCSCGEASITPQCLSNTDLPRRERDRETIWLV